MKTERELITQMLEALERANVELVAYADDGGEDYNNPKINTARDAAREYLAAPEQSEPVAMLEITVRGGTTTIDNHFSAAVMGWPAGEYQLYTHPAPKAEPVNQMLLEGDK